MDIVIFNPISGIQPNNGGSISINIGKSTRTYLRNTNTDLNTLNLNNKYQSKFFNDIEYNLWPPSDYPSVTNNQATPTTTTTPTASIRLTPTVTPTATSTVTPTVTLTPSTSSSIVILTNSANYNNCGGGLANVGTSGRSSYYGTYDMSGNIWEWLETNVGPENKVLRGGNAEYNASYIISSARSYVDKSFSNQYFGFRIAASQITSVYTNLVLVGDVNNIADSSGYGSMLYQYYIGKYEITNNEYIEFLNSIAKTDTYGLYNTAMNWSNFGGILRTGSLGSYQYTAKTNMGNRPVNFINWASCARYCNWLCNNKPIGTQNNATTEDGAYNMSLVNPSRNNSAIYFIPNENEWYKAAYYKGGSTNAGYWSYATQSDTVPNCVQLTSYGDGIPV